MKLVPLTVVAPLVADRVQPFDDSRPYIATGGLDDDGNFYPDMVMYENRPTRADLCVLPGDVCMARMQGTLKVFLFEATHSKLILSTGFAVFRPVPELDSRYLFHYLRADRVQDTKDALCSGATQKAITNEKIATLEIPLPSLAEQRRIADILDQAESLRVKRRAALAQLATLTQAYFLDLFGDPATNPKKWPRAKLEDAILRASDGPHVSPNYSESGIPFLSTRHVRAGEITWEDMKFISRDDAEFQWRKCKPEFGDILYTKGGTTGLAAMVTTYEPFAIWVHIALLKPKPEKVDPLWLESMLNSTFCYRQSQELTHGIANRDLGLTRMIEINMFLPPLPLQHVFANQVTSMKKLRAAYHASLDRMDALFATLQHNSFRGEL